MANIQAREQARNPIVSPNADWGALGMDKLGNLFTANWPTRLALAGKVFSLDLGAADTWLAGNHDVDADQPEFIISVNEGWLLPISMSLGAYSICDAAADMTKVIVVADRTQATTTATATTETALNVLDGGPSFGGNCFSVATGNITINEADILYSAVTVAALGTNGVAQWGEYKFSWHDNPRFLKGPCKIVGYVVGEGTTQTSVFAGNFTFAHVPESWIQV